MIEKLRTLLLKPKLKDILTIEKQLKSQDFESVVVKLGVKS